MLSCTVLSCIMHNYPVSWRRKIFDLIHGLSHPSIRATRKLISSKFIWKGMNSQVGSWAKTCVQCQSSKIHTHIKSPLETFNVPHRRFDHIHVDLVGPLPPSDGFTHLLTIVDRFSCWPEAVPLNDISTVACARALIYHWISRFGIPMDMSSDRGSQFTSQLWSSVAKLLGITLHHTTAYHPQANGTARQCTVCSLVYCTHTNRYSSALDTWAVFHTSRMRRHVYVSERTLRLYV